MKQAVSTSLGLQVMESQDAGLRFKEDSLGTIHALDVVHSEFIIPFTYLIGADENICFGQRPISRRGL
jgi:hypothetical protein